MHGRRACRLVKEFNSGEKGQLNHFNEELLNEVAKECSENFLVLQSLIRKMQEEGLDFQTTRNADHYGALINHLSLIRNKRCLMAYVYNRAEMIQNLAWTVGLRLFELPEEIQEKLSHPEKEYFKKHSSALESYMSKVDLDLNVDMVPPKDPYIKVRVLDDIGEGIVVSDKAANFARHSMHFLKRTDAELYISRLELAVKLDHIIIITFFYGDNKFSQQSKQIGYDLTSNISIPGQLNPDGTANNDFLDQEQQDVFH